MAAAEVPLDVECTEPEESGTEDELPSDAELEAYIENLTEEDDPSTDPISIKTPSPIPDITRSPTENITTTGLVQPVDSETAPSEETQSMILNMLLEAANLPATSICRSSTNVTKFLDPASTSTSISSTMISPTPTMSSSGSGLAVPMTLAGRMASRCRTTAWNRRTANGVESSYSPTLQRYTGYQRTAAPSKCWSHPCM